MTNMDGGTIVLPCGNEGIPVTLYSGFVLKDRHPTAKKQILGWMFQPIRNLVRGMGGHADDASLCLQSQTMKAVFPVHRMTELTEICQTQGIRVTPVTKSL